MCQTLELWDGTSEPMNPSNGGILSNAPKLQNRENIKHRASREKHQTCRKQTQIWKTIKVAKTGLTVVDNLTTRVFMSFISILNN